MYVGQDDFPDPLNLAATGHEVSRKPRRLPDVGERGQIRREDTEELTECIVVAPLLPEVDTVKVT